MAEFNLIAENDTIKYKRFDKTQGEYFKIANYWDLKK